MKTTGTPWASALMTVPCPPWVTNALAWDRTAPCGPEITVTTLAALDTSSGEIASPRVTIALTGDAPSAVNVRRSTSP
jgi:hypothetical protein